MKTSTKIWLCITGLLLIILGVVCIAKPDITLISAAWVLGCITLLSGVAKLVFTFRTQAFLPNSGTRALSALLDIFFGCRYMRCSHGGAGHVRQRRNAEVRGKALPRV